MKNEQDHTFCLFTPVQKGNKMARWENKPIQGDILKEKDQLLALKVMRLTRPTIKPLLQVTCEEQDLPGECFENDFKSDAAAIKGIELFSSGELLSLPQSFGSIYLGETFSCYLSVLNDSNQHVQDVVAKVDLQTSSQRFQLSASSPYPKLGPDESIDEVIGYEVKELGTHILVCAVTYSTTHEENLGMRKFFKFQVLKPLEVKTKFHNVSDTVYLEAQVQNITTSLMSIVGVTLEPSSYYDVVDLNECKTDTDMEGDDENDDIELTFGNSYLNPMDTRQYLYQLAPKNEYAVELINKNVTPIGKLDIVWRTNFGEVGRLQTSQLQKAKPVPQEVELKVESCPISVKLEEEFTLKCSLRNSGESKMEVKLFLTDPKSGGLLWSGVSGKVLGPLPPGSSIDLDLSIVPTCTGLQNISGIRILDMNSTKVNEFDNVGQVIVYGTGESPFR
ncbi:trafficking protein particle complex subunit 13-like [Rhopilema esculentum]|uniref:trafficking protein particle complex subunit 13-like n=1 Tax=Rhopilema esculentum TaxID=499914 RepID=UPI0031D1C72F